MARGWESKSVESQQADASEGTASTAARSLTPEALAAHAERRTLELARNRLRADLLTATVPAHREMLSRALGDLEHRIHELLLPPQPPASGR